MIDEAEAVLCVLEEPASMLFSLQYETNPPNQTWLSFPFFFFFSSDCNIIPSMFYDMFKGHAGS